MGLGGVRVKIRRHVHNQDNDFVGENRRNDEPFTNK